MMIFFLLFITLIYCSSYIFASFFFCEKSIFYVSICFLKNNHFLSRSNMKKAENFSLFSTFGYNFKSLIVLVKYAVVYWLWIIGFLLQNFGSFLCGIASQKLPLYKAQSHTIQLKTIKKFHPSTPNKQLHMILINMFHIFHLQNFYSKNKISSFCR